LPNSKISRRATETQARKKWSPPGGVLGELLLTTAARVRALRESGGWLRLRAAAAPKPRRFAEALAGDQLAIVAELKRASPSKGAINPLVDVADQCSEYESGGAVAISVLTEPSRFSGSLADLVSARGACSLPLLMKDFMIDELQLLEARAAGASAVLLIARALEPARLRELYAAAVEAELCALVEIRSEAELDRALSMGARVIGVNNRDLESLEMDDAAARLIPRIPRSCIAVAESGYRNVGEISRAAAAGADAVLIGSELSAAAKPSEAVRALTRVPRSSGARPN
jgi:indole-3-glycerol phosphate synthase